MGIFDPATTPGRINKKFVSRGIFGCDVERPIFSCEQHRMNSKDDVTMTEDEKVESQHIDCQLNASLQKAPPFL